MCTIIVTNRLRRAARHQPGAATGLRLRLVVSFVQETAEVAPRSARVLMTKLASDGYGWSEFNLLSAPLVGFHPIAGSTDQQQCRAACTSIQRCTGAVWNCAHQCFLKSAVAPRLSRTREHCTWSWVPRKSWPRCLGVLGPHADSSSSPCCSKACGNCTAGSRCASEAATRSCLQSRGTPPCTMGTLDQPAVCAHGQDSYPQPSSKVC